MSRIDRNLISTAYLSFVVNFEDTGEFHEPVVIEDALDTEMMAVPRKVVPLIDIDAVPFIGNNLECSTWIVFTSILHANTSRRAAPKGCSQGIGMRPRTFIDAPFTRTNLICHHQAMHSIARLYRKAQPRNSIIYITLHRI